MSTPTRIPLILWSQRTKTVTIKLEVSDCTLERLKIEGNHLVFKGKNEEAPYALDVDLHGRLTGCTLVAKTKSYIELGLSKGEFDWWPSLLKESGNTRAEIKVDSKSWIEKIEAVRLESAEEDPKLPCRKCSSSVELSKVTTHYAAHERCKQLGLDLFKLFWNVKLKAQLDAKQKERVDVPVGPKTEEGAKSEQPASSTAPASTTTTSAANAVAILEGDGTTGAVWFTQEKQGGPVKVEGEIFGLTPGLHGFHVHQDGHHTNACPFDKAHGGPKVGDLGNVKVESDGSCKFKFTDELITLNGDATVIGHSLIVHAKADESSHGTSGTKEESQKTGNADAPSAYGQIVYAALS